MIIINVSPKFSRLQFRGMKKVESRKPLATLSNPCHPTGSTSPWSVHGRLLADNRHGGRKPHTPHFFSFLTPCSLSRRAAPPSFNDSLFCVVLATTLTYKTSSGKIYPYREEGVATRVDDGGGSKTQIAWRKVKKCPSHVLVLLPARAEGRK